MTISRFHIAVPDDALEDLRWRLASTRWSEQFPDAQWEYGVDQTFVRDLCECWEHEFDWRVHERTLNAHDQYTTEIDGATLHFLHVRSPEPDAVPLLMTHGWPGSVVEFSKVLGPLTDPVRHGGRAEDAFHVVCPSIPGFAFSGPPRDPGWNVRRVALALATLMDRLGYTHFGAQGGDFGGAVSTWLGALAPDRVLGIHLNTVPMTTEVPEWIDDPTAAELAALARIHAYYADGAGYRDIQGTRPNTIGVALDDSPAGLCAWIVDKFHAWSDHRGDVLTSFTRDELLANVMVYWVTRTATSAARIYYENRADPSVAMPPRVEVPTGCAIAPAEIATPTRRWVAPRYDIVHWTSLPRGGHFLAYEAPDLFTEDVRTFFRRFR